MIRMKNLDRITSIKLRVEFKCDNRIGFIEAQIQPSDLDNPTYVQRSIDESIDRFIMNNSRGIKMPLGYSPLD
jgi:hypothetical protein